MRARVVTGVVLGVLAIAAFLTGAAATVALTSVVLGLCVIELSNALRRAGYQPATLLAIVAAVGAPVAVYQRGVDGLLVVIAISTAFSLLWFLAKAGDESPVLNAGVTMLSVAYIGVLGSYGALMLRVFGHYGIGMILAAVLGTVGHDIGALLVGRSAGKTKLTSVSPGKTREGLLGGMLTAIIVVVVAVGMFKIAPFGEVPADRNGIWYGGMPQAALLGLAHRGDGAARRSRRVADQARSRRQGHGQHPQGPRWRARPVRRAAVHAAGHLLHRPLRHPLSPHPPSRNSCVAPIVDDMTTTLAVLGSTGSIGTQTLDIVRAAPERFEVVALGASTSVKELAAQAHEFRPRVVALADSARAAELRELIPSAVEVLTGPDALADAAREGQMVINGVVGFAGLPVTLGRTRRRPPPRPGEQRVVDRGRAGRGARAVDSGRRVAAGRQRALRAASMPAGQRQSGARGQAGAHRERRAVPGQDARASWPRSRSTTRWSIRRGAWAPRSPSTRRRS